VRRSGAIPCDKIEAALESGVMQKLIHHRAEFAIEVVEGFVAGHLSPPLFARRTPAPRPFSGMNSTPASSALVVLAIGQTARSNVFTTVFRENKRGTMPPVNSPRLPIVADGVPYRRDR
jgi:hypothetical protein